MNIESVREYCLSLPMTTEDMAFGDDYLLLRVCDRNQLRLQSGLSDDLVKGLIRHSYSEAVKKLTKKVKTEHPEILEINENIE
jgi:predicted DNA-binding protein (MmcQ/YjbR family)